MCGQHNQHFKAIRAQLRRHFNAKPGYLAKPFSRIAKRLSGWTKCMHLQGARCKIQGEVCGLGEADAL